MIDSKRYLHLLKRNGKVTEKVSSTLISLPFQYNFKELKCFEESKDFEELKCFEELKNFEIKMFEE